MIHTTKIYLITNCYNDPNKVYIGKTKSSRRNAHKLTYGNQITYTIIDEISSIDRKDWEPLETYWIQQFIIWGFEVINKRKKGGNGPEFHSEETKQKLRKPKPKGFRFGIKHSEETKQKLRKPKSEEWKDKLKCPRPNSGWYGKRNKLHIQKISKANSKPKPIGFGDKLSKIKSGKPSSKKGTGKSILQYDLQGNLIKKWDNAKEISFSLNKTPNLVYDCCKGRVKTAYGYKWEYENS